MSIEKTSVATERPDQLAKKLRPDSKDNGALGLLIERNNGVTLPTPLPSLPELHIQINPLPQVHESPGVLGNAITYGSDAAMLLVAGYFAKTRPITALGSALVGGSMLVRDIYGHDDLTIATKTAMGYSAGLGSFSAK